MADLIELALSPDDALALLETRAHALLANPGRQVLGIAGGPGAGKSTMATRLVERLNAAAPGTAAYVPMDGFHMKHSKLEALGTVAEKGMPHTFEGAAFADFLARLKTAQEPVSGPYYSRKIEDVVDAAFTVPADTKLLVVEGNYLLLLSSPWWRIRPMLDDAVFLELDRELVRARLLKRHAEEGLFTEERNRAHIERVDLPNHDRVLRSAGQADLIIRVVTDS